MADGTHRVEKNKQTSGPTLGHDPSYISLSWIIFRLWGVKFTPVLLQIVEKQMGFSGWSCCWCLLLLGWWRWFSPLSTSGGLLCDFDGIRSEHCFFLKKVWKTLIATDNKNMEALCIIKVTNAPLNHLIFQTWCDSRRGHVEDWSPVRRRRCVRALDIHRCRTEDINVTQV